MGECLTVDIHGWEAGCWKAGVLAVFFSEANFEGAPHAVTGSGSQLLKCFVPKSIKLAAGRGAPVPRPCTVHFRVKSVKLRDGFCTKSKTEKWVLFIIELYEVGSS